MVFVLIPFKPQKTLLWWLLHLPVRLQLILSCSLSCRCDRPSTSFTQIINHNSINHHQIPTEICSLCVPNFSSIRVCIHILWPNLQSVQNEGEKCDRVCKKESSTHTSNSMNLEDCNLLIKWHTKLKISLVTKLCWYYVPIKFQINCLY